MNLQLEAKLLQLVDRHFRGPAPPHYPAVFKDVCRQFKLVQDQNPKYLHDSVAEMGGFVLFRLWLAVHQAAVPKDPCLFYQDADKLYDQCEPLVFSRPEHSINDESGPKDSPSDAPSGQFGPLDECVIREFREAHADFLQRNMVQAGFLFDLIQNQDPHVLTLRHLVRVLRDTIAEMDLAKQREHSLSNLSSASATFQNVASTKGLWEAQHQLVEPESQEVRNLVNRLTPYMEFPKSQTRPGPDLPELLQTEAFREWRDSSDRIQGGNPNWLLLIHELNRQSDPTSNTALDAVRGICAMRVAEPGLDSLRSLLEFAAAVMVAYQNRLGLLKFIFIRKLVGPAYMPFAEDPSIEELFSRPAWEIHDFVFGGDFEFWDSLGGLQCQFDHLLARLSILSVADDTPLGFLPFIIQRDESDDDLPVRCDFLALHSDRPRSLAKELLMMLVSRYCQDTPWLYWNNHDEFAAERLKRLARLDANSERLRPLASLIHSSETRETLAGIFVARRTERARPDWLLNSDQVSLEGSQVSLQTSDFSLTVRSLRRDQFGFPELKRLIDLLNARTAVGSAEELAHETAFVCQLEGCLKSAILGQSFLGPLEAAGNQLESTQAAEIQVG